MKVELSDIQEARQRIQSVVKPTEMDISNSLSKLLGIEAYYKFENTQWTGSFKLRGAANKIMSLSAEEKARGVIASSAGNHAQGVAYSAQKAGIRSIIVMPTNAALIKVSATKGYGAEVILHGDVVDDSHKHVQKLVQEHGYVRIHPYEDEKVIAGQGTIGLEMLEKIPDLDSVVIPIGGGGLISGIATAIKAIHPNCRVIGVQSEQAPGMKNLFYHESDQTPQKISTIADGIAIKYPSQNMFHDFIEKRVDEIVTVSDDEIAEAIVFLIERAKTVVEGAGATALAAVMNRKLNLGKKTCVLLCGGNIDLNIVSKIIERGQTRKGRLCELSVIVDDLPGSMSRLTQVIASQKANIIQVHHDRLVRGLYLRETQIDFVLETTSHEHIEQIKSALTQLGVRVLQK